MKNFIKGIFLVAFVLPLVDNIVSILSQLSEYICMRIAKHTVAIQKEITEQQQQSNQEESCTSVIGFHVPD